MSPACCLDSQRKFIPPSGCQDRGNSHTRLYFVLYQAEPCKLDKCFLACLDELCVAMCLAQNVVPSSFSYSSTPDKKKSIIIIIK